FTFQPTQDESKRLWKADVGGGHSSCVIADGKL
ncbi:MAG: hypothetical protein ACI8UO_006767, partial [Verrucomicrobiales bacterium]